MQCTLQLDPPQVLQVCQRSCWLFILLQGTFDRRQATPQRLVITPPVCSSNSSSGAYVTVLTASAGPHASGGISSLSCAATDSIALGLLCETETQHSGEWDASGQQMLKELCRLCTWP